MRKLVLVLLTLTLAAPVVAAYAGGWATVKLNSTPKGLAAGQPWALRMTVLQHGVTPLENVQPSLRIRKGAVTRTFYAKPTTTVGMYRTMVRFPSAGTWSWSIWDGFSQRHTYKPVLIRAAAPVG